MPRRRASAGNANKPSHTLARASFRVREVSVYQQLCMAALSADEASTHKFLSRIEHLHCKDPLRLAVEGGHVAIARLLLTRPEIAVDERFEGGQTSLHLACQCGHEEMARFLLESRADVTAQCHNGCSPLHYACKGLLALAPEEDPVRHLRVVQRLLACHAPLYATDEAQDTPLHYAVRAAHEPLMGALLVQEGASQGIDTYNRARQTPLHTACQIGSIAAVQLLLAHHASPTLTSHRGYPALHECIWAGHTHLAQLIAQQPGVHYADRAVDGDSPLHISARRPEDEAHVVQFLLDQRLPVDIMNTNKETPLYVACGAGNLACAQLLIKREASLHVDGLMHVTCGHNHMALLEFLLTLQLPCDQPNHMGEFPIHAAAHRHAPDTLAALLTRHPSHVHLTTTKRGHYTPLHLASKRGHAPIAQQLLAAQASLHALDQHGNTPLHLACAAGHLPLVALLTEAKADVSVENQQGMTPFELVSDKRVAAWALSGEFPAPHLQELDVSGCGLMTLPARGAYWASLKALKRLHVQGNGLTALPVGMLDAPVLEVVSLMDNPLEDVPSSIKRKDCHWKDIKAYLRTLQESSTRWNEKKIFVIGASHAGKSSLLSVMHTGKLCSSRGARRRIAESLHLGGGGGIRRSKKLPTPTHPSEEDDHLSLPDNPMASPTLSGATGGGGGEDSRVLIDIQRNKPLTGPKTHLFDKRTEVHFCATSWSFESEIANHCPFFFTNQAVYILVFNALTLNEHILALDRWVQQIRVQTQRALPPVDILLVGTRRDDEQCSKEYIQRTMALLMDRYPSNRYPQVRGVFILSTKTGRGFRRFIEALQECGTKIQPVVNPAWLVMHRHVLDLATTSPYITWERFTLLAQKIGIPPEQHDDLTHFLCTTSTIMDLQSGPASGRPPPLLVLDPLWLADVVASLRKTMRAHWRVQSLRQLMPVVQGWLEMDAMVQEMLVGVLIDHQVVYELADGSILCPWLLPVGALPPSTCSECGWSRYPSAQEIQHGRVFDFTFLPLGLMERLISTTTTLLSPTIHMHAASSHQVFYSQGQQSALVTYIPRRIDQPAYQLRIQARTPWSTHEEAVLFIQLVQHVEHLIESFYSHLKSTLHVWVECAHCMSTPLLRANPHRFAYRECVRAHLECQPPVLYCRGIQARGRQLQVSWIAPDITLALLRDALIPDDHLLLLRHLGEGATGQVHLCQWRPHHNHTKDNNKDKDKEQQQQQQVLVAVKVLSRGGRDFLDEEDRLNTLVQQYSELTREIHLMIQLDHPSIIAFHGLCERPLRLVMEYAPAGDLHQLIRTPQPDTGAFLPQAHTLPWPFRYRIALDVALGMQYLARRGLIHRDLRSPNIFMMQRGPSPSPGTTPVAKVADFGLSVYALPKASGDLRTWRWLAPEVFHYSTVDYDGRADVYSMGVVLWELIDGAFPFGEYTDDEWEVQEAIVQVHLRPTIPRDRCDPAYAALIQQCWQARPQDRPTWDQIVGELCGLLGEEAPWENVPAPLSPTTPPLAPALGQARATPLRDTRFSSFSQSTVPQLPLACCALMDRVHDMTRAPDGMLWVGSRDGTLSVFDERLDLQESWRNPRGSVRALHTVLMPTGGHQVWSVAHDNSLALWPGHTPFHQQQGDWIVLPTPITASASSFFQGTSSLWVACTPEPLGYPLTIVDASTRATTQIMLAPPTHYTRNELMASCVVHMQQYQEIMLVGTQQFVYIVDLESCESRGYWAVNESDRLQQILALPDSHHLWTISAQQMRVWAVGEGLSVVRRSQLEAHSSKMVGACAVVCGDKQWVCSVSFDGHVVVWDTESLCGVHELFLPPTDVPTTLFMGRTEPPSLYVLTRYTPPKGEESATNSRLLEMPLSFPALHSLSSSR